MTPYRTLAWAALALTLSGCASDDMSAASQAHRTSRGGEVGTDIGYNGQYGPIPDADPTRKISDQDCTRPLNPDGGNLRCK